MAELVVPITTFTAQWASIFWATLRETAPFLVLGLLLAGVLHVLVPSRIILWALGYRGFRGAVRGSLVGLPLPLCSCGVVPTALALRRQGASLSAATAFTIATPETSVDALAITAALMPVAFLGVRPVAALLLAVIVGTCVELFSSGTQDELRVNVMKLARQSPHGHAPDESCEADREAEADICRVCGLMVGDEKPHAHHWVSRAGAVFTYAFGTFFRDIATWVVLGLGLAALLQQLLPSDGLQATFLARYPSLQVAFAIIACIPLYSCATATTPLAAVLLTKGLNPGAALALLLAGPATNIASIFALKRELGTRTTAVYYASLLSCCWLLGIAFNFAWPLIERYPQLTEIARIRGLDWIHGMPPWLEIGAALVIGLLTLHHWGRQLFEKRGDGHDHHAHHEHGDHGHAH